MCSAAVRNMVTVIGCCTLVRCMVELDLVLVAVSTRGYQGRHCHNGRKLILQCRRYWKANRKDAIAELEEAQMKMADEVEEKIWRVQAIVKK